MLADLATDDSPFDPPPPKDYKGRWGGELKYVVWTRPEVVIRAELGGWTRDGIVRQAAFKGFDEGGKPPTEVVREQPVAAAATVDAVEAALPEADAAATSERHTPARASARTGKAADMATKAGRAAKRTLSRRQIERSPGSATTDELGGPRRDDQGRRMVRSVASS